MFDESLAQKGLIKPEKPYTLIQGDCLVVMRTLADSSVDAVVTDPPYELGFMGRSWDCTGIANNIEVWREALRVLKPGGHLLAFSGTRTSHRMVCAIEDAGFEIRDSIPWLYGSGFPKSQNISKAIDKQAGAERQVLAEGKAVKRMIPGADQDESGSWIKDSGREYVPTVTAAATAEAAQWEGWGSALKPAHEPCCMARKPLAKGLTVAANVLAHGTGGLNIEGCRVPVDDASYTRNFSGDRGHAGTTRRSEFAIRAGKAADGRWPANIIHDGSAAVVALFPAEAGQQAALKTRSSGKTRNTFGDFAGSPDADFAPHDERGSAARFFYCPKASRADRNEGVGASSTPAVGTDATMREREIADWPARNGNHHPTVKPTDLMAYLVRLVTSPGGLVLDPFMGSGSTGKACIREGMRFIGIDLSAEYVEIARARIEHEISAVAARAAAAQEAADLAACQIDLFTEVP